MKRKLFSIRYLLFFVTVLSAASIFTSCSSKEDDPIITYTVSFKTNSSTLLDAKKIEKGKTVTKLDAPSKSGYTFKGWYTTASFTGEPYAFSTAVTGNLTLYAKYTKIAEPLTVTFNTLGGSTVNSQKVTSEGKIKRPKDPTKADYEFKGWYTTASFTGAPYDFNSVVSKDLTLYAKFVKLFTVTFQMSGGTPVAPEASVASGDKVKKPQTPTSTKAGYKFEGWYKDTGFLYVFDFNTEEIIANQTIYAKFTQSFTVTFQMNGGTPAAPEASVISGGKAEKPQDPTKADYKFEGWYTTVSFTGEPYVFSTKVTGSFILYAKFTAIYTITLVENGGSEIPDLHVIKGQTADRPTPPTLSNYGFVGWYKDAGFKNSFSFETNKITGNITLYAKWSSNFVTVTFNLEGNTTVVPLQNVAKNSSASSPIVPKKDGHRFDKWYTDTGYTTVYDFSTVVTAATTLYGRYIKQVTVTLHYNDTVTPDVNKKMDTGTAFSQPSPPTRLNYTFEGWYTDDKTFNSPYTFSTAPTTDVNLYAKWQIIKYTVSFVTASAGTIPKTEVDHGGLVKITNAPTKAGHTLVGWYRGSSFTNSFNLSSDRVTSNLILYAKWQIIKYTVSFNVNSGTPAIGPVIVDYNTPVGKPTASLTKENSVFKDWYTTATFSGAPYVFSTIVTGSFTLYAKFAPTFKIIFDLKDGSGDVPPQNIESGGKVTEPTKKLTKTDFVFEKWYTTSDTSGTPYNFDTAVTGSFTLYAKWKVPPSPMSTVCTSGTMPDLNATEFESIKPMLEPLGVATGTALACLHFSPKGTDTATGADWDHALSTGQLKAKLDGITDATKDKVYLVLLSKGTYKPTTGTDRTVSFIMKNHTAIIGGWDNAYAYDVKANTSLLSGDIGVENDKSDNTYHIIFNKTKMAVLYGVTLSYGNANGGGLHDKGGAMYNANNRDSSLNIIQSTFTNNTAAAKGGVMYNAYFAKSYIFQSTFTDNTADRGGAIFNDYNAIETITQSTFKNNTATDWGGAIYNTGTRPKNTIVAQSTFSGNKATNFGGAIALFSSSLQITQSTFSGNMANKGGAIYKSNRGGANKLLSLFNVILWGNSLSGANGSGSQIYLNTNREAKENLDLSSIVLEGGVVGIGFNPSYPNEKQITENNIITTNPNLGVLADNGGAVQTMAIPSNSSAVNQGEDKGLSTDARGYTFSGKPDIGAYEYGGTKN